MMLKTIAFLSLAIVAAVMAAPPGPVQNQQDPKDVVILKYQNENIGVNGYQFAYETSDGQSRSETAEIVNPGTDNEHIAVRGVISYVAPDGTPIHMEYVADENGFQPVGAHIPK